MSRTQSFNRTRISRGPPIVVPDLDNGCESTACYIAQTFYNSCRDQITNINNRNKLREFFVTSQRFWFPPELTERNEYRHFDQVLYALVNDGGVCRVRKTSDGSHAIVWGINDFRRNRSHPRRRINPPSNKRKREDAEVQQGISLDDLANDRGEPLTMADLETGQVDSPNTVVNND